MNIEHLIRMANQIGDFFCALPDENEGIEGVTNHIEKFWEPRMRKQILEFVASHPNGHHDNAELSALVLAALKQNYDRLTPKTTSPS